MSSTVGLDVPVAATTRDTIFVVSDVHLASKHFYDENQKQRLWALLEDIGNNPRSRELVLNGDIIETWSSPIELHHHSLTMHQAVFTLEKIFAHEDVVKFALIIRQIIAKGVRVFYIIGNHDSRVQVGAIRGLLGDSVEVLYTYVNYGIHFSHGHKYDYFNSTDPVGERGFPIGYYATRVDYNNDIGFTHQKRDSLRDTMNHVLPDLTKSRLIVAEKTIVSAFMTHMFMKARPFHTLWTTGKVPMITNQHGEGETMSTISRKLKQTYQIWAMGMGDDYVAATLRCAMTADYGWFIESGHYGNVTHVVHGHTHNGLIKAYGTPTGQITYVNNGAWEDDRRNFAKFVLSPQLTVASCEICAVL